MAQGKIDKTTHIRKVPKLTDLGKKKKIGGVMMSKSMPKKSKKGGY